MWVFRQSSGELSLNGDHVATGYSGTGEGKNNPVLEAMANVGPIPRGHYSIGPRYESETRGPVVMRLFADKGTRAHGRSGFLIHGDSIGAPGTASHGCIILDRVARMRVAASRDTELEVVA